MIDVPILVKDALKDGRRKKNYRILVLNDDGTTDFVIDNNTLVSEQVDIDERMCSGDTIKFGLCEGSSFQFQYFDHPNITDRQIQVFIDAQYIGTGYENVQKFQRYRFITLEEGGNYRAYSANADGFSKLYLIRNGSTQQLTPTSTDTETYVEFEGMVGDKLEVEWTQFPLYDTYLQKQISDMILEYPIPIGFFTVKNCSRQASTGIIKAVCYNKLQSDYLDAKANKLLLETFDGDETTQLTLFDIQRNLLVDYGIIEREKIALTMAEVPYSPTTIYHGPIKFSSLYNIDSPLSAANFQSKTSNTPSLNTEYSLCLFTTGADIYTETSYYWDIKFLKGKIDWFAHAYASQAATLIANAQLLSNNSLITYENAYNWIVSTFSFYILYNNTVYNLLTDGDSKLREIDKLVHHNEAVRIRIVIPRGIGITYSDAHPFEFVKWQETNNYVYWQKEGDLDPITVQGEYPPLITFSYGYGYFDTSVDISNMFAVNAYDLSDAEIIQFTISDIPEFTLRDIVGANYETQCQFGQLDRVTDLFSGVELNHSRLLPSDTLYPDNALYPSGAQESAFRSQYSKLWADEGNVRKWRYLNITYKGLDENGNEKDYTLQRTVNNDGTDNYNCSDNWLFRNLVWTAEQIGEYADEMVSKMRDMTWFPFEMWCAGLPYIETGDEIEISINQQTYTSYVLQRQLKGIQNLQDTFINGTLDIF